MNDLIKRLRQSGALQRWANDLANIRQGMSDTPRCEPPSEYAIGLAEDALVRWVGSADRLTAMKAAGDGLAGFAGHTRICAANMFMDEVCTCGLTAALKQWKEASDGL